jgi:hypothetical protein
VSALGSSTTTIIIAVVCSVFGLACVIIIVAVVLRQTNQHPVSNVNVVVENKVAPSRVDEPVMGMPMASSDPQYPPEAGGSTLGPDGLQYPPEAGGSVTDSVYASKPKKKKSKRNGKSGSDHTGYDASGACKRKRERVCVVVLWHMMRCCLQIHHKLELMMRIVVHRISDVYILLPFFHCAPRPRASPNANAAVCV